MKILLATWNKLKIQWLTTGFSKLNLPISPIDKKIEDVEETGATCAENAIIKVDAIGSLKNTIIIGEDSALSIDALNGFPGVKTVRWMEGTDDERAAKILEKMESIPPQNRNAKFLSSIAILFPDNKLEICDGVMKGKISHELIGEEGKGYQRIFLLENGQAISESESEIIQENDHRDQAINKAIKSIQNWLNQYEQ